MRNGRQGSTRAKRADASHEVPCPGVRLHVPVRLQPPGRSPKHPARSEVVMGWRWKSRKPALGAQKPSVLRDLQHLPPPCQPGLSPQGPAASGVMLVAACPDPRHREPRKQSPALHPQDHPRRWHLR